MVDLCPAAEAGAMAAYAVPLEGSTWQTDSFFNIGILPNTTFYCFPFADIFGTLPHDPAGAGEVAAALRLLRPQRPMPEVTKAASNG